MAASVFSQLAARLPGVAPASAILAGRPLSAASRWRRQHSPSTRSPERRASPARPDPPDEPLWSNATGRSMLPCVTLTAEFRFRTRAVGSAPTWRCILQPGDRPVAMRTLLLPGLALLLPAQAKAQEAPGRSMLEAGIAGDSRACPGYYVGIDARVAGPVSLYGMVENCRCAGRTGDIGLGGGITGTAIYPRRVGSDRRIGASVLLGRSGWLVRPALRAGIQYGSGDYVGPTADASLTSGRHYGARSIIHVEECGNAACARFQMGGHVSF